jgi:NADPH:quinone reductase-like Zn-dependent oxidoreductase
LVGIQERSFSILVKGGILVSVVSKPDRQTAAKHGVRATWFIAEITTARLSQIATRIDNKALRVNVGAVLPLADARTAHEMMAGKVPRPRGKIVLRTDR